MTDPIDLMAASIAVVWGRGTVQEAADVALSALETNGYVVLAPGELQCVGSYYAADTGRYRRLHWDDKNPHAVGCVPVYIRTQPNERGEDASHAEEK